MQYCLNKNWILENQEYLSGTVRCVIRWDSPVPEKSSFPHTNRIE